jgi:hypothetical protein
MGWPFSRFVNRENRGAAVGRRVQSCRTHRRSNAERVPDESRSDSRLSHRMRGGEKCLEVFCELFPDADLYTLVYDPERVAPAIRRMHVRRSWIDRLPGARNTVFTSIPAEFCESTKSDFLAQCCKISTIFRITSLNLSPLMCPAL